MNGSVNFSAVQFLDRLGRRGDTTDDSPEILFRSFLQEAQFWHGQGSPVFDVVHPAFLLPTTALLILQGAMKKGFREVD